MVLCSFWYLSTLIYVGVLGTTTFCNKFFGLSIWFNIGIYFFIWFLWPLSWNIFKESSYVYLVDRKFIFGWVLSNVSLFVTFIFSSFLLVLLLKLDCDLFYVILCNMLLIASFIVIHFIIRAPVFESYSITIFTISANIRY